METSMGMGFPLEFHWTLMGMGVALGLLLRIGIGMIIREWEEIRTTGVISAHLC